VLSEHVVSARMGAANRPLVTKLTLSAVIGFAVARHGALRPQALCDWRLSLIGAALEPSRLHPHSHATSFGQTEIALMP
jgi:hypothetical protein